MSPAGVPNLQLLRADFNCIGDEGMKALAKAWAEDGALELQELHLSGNEITSVGVQALAPQLARAPKLRTLAFGSSSGGNKIGDEGARALAKALVEQPARAHGTLVINLKTNRITPSCEAELSAAVKAQSVSFASMSSSSWRNVGHSALALQASEGEDGSRVAAPSPAPSADAKEEGDGRRNDDAAYEA